MIYRGRVSRINGDDLYVQISALAVDQDFGPMEIISIAPYQVNDYVLVNQIEGAAEDLVIVGLIRDSLEQVIPGMPLPNAADSFFTGNIDGTYQWKNKTQAKASLDIDDAESAIATLQTAVQPVSRGGTGVTGTSMTSGDLIRFETVGGARYLTTSAAQVKTWAGLNLVDNTSDASKPVSTAQQTALDGKRDKDGPVAGSGVDFNTITTSQDLSVGAVNIVASTNTPPSPTRGILSVFTSGGYIIQRYQMVDSATTWTRTYSGSAWSAWTRVAVVNTTWTNITFADANWIAYGTPYSTPQYKVTDGTVKLRGLVESSIFRTGNNNIIASFASFAPAGNEIFSQGSSAVGPTGAASTGTAHTHNTYGGSGFVRVDIANNGNLMVMADGSRSIPVGGWVSLSGITWDVA